MIFFLFNIANKIHSKLCKQLLQGLFFGVIVFVAMLFPHTLTKGLFFDARSIVISLATHVFGLVPGAITSVVAGIFRVYTGGPGLIMGLLTISTAFGLGLIFHLFYKRYSSEPKKIDVFILSMLVHLVMFSLILTLPTVSSDQVKKEMGVTILLIYPFISLIVGRLLYEQFLNIKNMNLLKEKEQLWRTTLYSIGDAVITTDKNGNIISMNKIAENLTGYAESEAECSHINNVFKIVSEFEEQVVENPIEKILSGERMVHLKNNTLLISRNNQKHPIADSASAIIGENGQLLGAVLVFRDQTKEREYIQSIEKAKGKIEAEKNRYETLVNMMFAGLLILKDNIIIYANKFALDILGVSELDELNQIGLKEFISEEDYKSYNDAIKELINIGEYKSLKVNLTSKSGKRCVILFRIGLVDYYNKKALGILMLDISEIERLKEIQEFKFNVAEALIKSKHLEKFLNSITQGISKLINLQINLQNIFIALYDKKTGLLYSSVEMDEKEKGPEKWIAKGSITGIVIEKNKSVLLKREEIEDLINSGKIKQIGHIPECWLGIPLSEGNDVFGAIVIQDYNDPDAITDKDRKLLEYIAAQISIFISKKIYVSKLEMMSRIVEESHTAIFITDSSGVIEYVNKKCCELYGYSSDELVSMNRKILKSEFHDIELYKNMWDTIKNKQIWSGELVNKTKKGELIWIKETNMPITDDKGEITHFVSLGEDITGQKNLIEKLTLEKSRAEEALRVMNNFLYNVSHEIRTPLNPILGYSSLVLETYENIIAEEHKSWFDAIRRNVKRMTDTIGKILDITKINQQQFPIKLEEFKVNEIIEDVVKRFEILASEKGLYLKLNLSEEKPVIRSDRYGFETIISNLISNAIKFTKAGGVTINSFIEKDSLIIEVIDTGIGISEDYKNLLFTPFSQEDMGTARAFEGIGLGLAVTKKFVDLLNGDILVESEKDKGSKFTVIFKLDKK